MIHNKIICDALGMFFFASTSPAVNAEITTIICRLPFPGTPTRLLVIDIGAKKLLHWDYIGHNITNLPLTFTDEDITWKFEIDGQARTAALNRSTLMLTVAIDKPHEVLPLYECRIADRRL
jgi:hypothetical protein